MKRFLFKPSVRYVPVLTIYKYLDRKNYMFNFKVSDFSDTLVLPTGSTKLKLLIKAFKEGYTLVYDRFTGDLLPINESVLENMIYSTTADPRELLRKPTIIPTFHPMTVKVRHFQNGRKSVEIQPPRYRRGDKLTIPVLPKKSYLVENRMNFFYPLQVAETEKLKLFIALDKKLYLHLLKVIGE